MLESIIQSKTIKVYQLHGWLVVKIISCTKAGWPDLQAHRNGVTVFIETKAPGKKPRPLQLHRHKQLQDAGFTVFVFNSIDQIRLP